MRSSSTSDTNQEKREPDISLELKAKAEEILAIQRNRARNVSIPKELLADVRQRSTYLYWQELMDHFRSKRIEEIEKSDAYIPSVKAAQLEDARYGNLGLPNLPEVVAEMSAKLLHPDALGQILAEHHAVEQARSKQRREKISKLFSFESWFGFPLSVPPSVRKLSAPEEVKSVLSALDEEARIMWDGPRLGIETIKPSVVEVILNGRDEIQRNLRSGKTPRAIVLLVMMNVTRNYLTSGRFHIYRGILSMAGNGLMSIYMYCLDELTKLGVMTAEEMRAARKATDEDIREMG
jgi:hypothetical protein